MIKIHKESFTVFGNVAMIDKSFLDLSSECRCEKLDIEVEHLKKKLAGKQMLIDSLHERAKRK